MFRDIGHTVRRLLRSPGQPLIIALILGLAIGASTAISSVVNGVLIRPLPFPHGERLYSLWQRAPGIGVEEDWFSVAQYFDLKEQAGAFDEMAILYGRNVTLIGDEAEPERLGALEASSSLFDLLGLQPTAGRRLLAEDDLPGSGRKALLSARLFERRFAGNPAIVGRSILLDDQSVTVIGVMPPFILDSDLIPTLATIPVFDLVLSMPVEDPQKTWNGSENYNVLARSGPTQTPQQIEASLLSVAEVFVTQGGSLGVGLKAGTEYRIGFVPLLDQIVGGVRLPLLVLLGATLLLLVIACANVANLLLTSAAQRRREFGIRLALGAPRGRMIGEAMTESLLLAGAGGAIGVSLTAAGLRALRWAAPEDLPRLGEVGIDFQVLLVAAGLCLGSSLLFGLGPALRSSGVDPTKALGEGSSRSASRSLRQGGASYLVVLQVALSVVLACGATLTIRTYQQLRSVDPGFNAEGVLSFRLSLVGERYGEPLRRVRFFQELHDRLRGVSEISAAGGISMLPLTRGYAWTDFIPEGWELLMTSKSDRMVADMHHVTMGYFESMKVPLLAGRTFERGDGTDAPVVMVNRSFATRFWEPEEAVGKWVATPGSKEKMTIIGVVDDVLHYGLDADPRPAVYYPHPRFGTRTLYTTLRTEADEDALAPLVARAIREVDPLLPVHDVRSMIGRVDDSLARQRVTMTLLNFFSGVALVLAVVGLYGILSFTVATQTREIGIRQALGAQRRDLYGLVFRRAASVTIVGLGIGLFGSLGLLRGLEGLVWGITTSDPPSLLMAMALVAMVAFCASLLPARRSAAVNPIEALRDE